MCNEQNKRKEHKKKDDPNTRLYMIVTDRGGVWIVKADDLFNPVARAGLLIILPFEW